MKNIDYTIGASLRDKIEARIWRLKGCDHDTPMCHNVGDEDHIYVYCFRCMRKVGE